MGTRRILVVDDERSIREVVKACLERLAGWQVITAESGQEGLLKAVTELPDAILLDVSMPGLDGFTTLKRLQENPVTRSLPVILLTARVQASERSEYAELGIAGLIIKPFDPVQICAQISQILGW